jgi:hypothetical protein
MLIHEKKPFIRGSLMILSFLVVFFFILTPIFHDEEGRPLTGLQFADNVFNELSKGSSNFIPAVRGQLKSLEGKTVDVTVKLKKPEQAELACKIISMAGLEATNDNGKLTFKGDISRLLAQVVDDSEHLYNNDDKAVVDRYGVPALDATSAIWYVLTPSIKELQKKGMIAEAKVIDQVIRRALEPGHNFFGVEPAKVKDHVLLLACMLIFYIVYTLWYGFSIFELFEGIGLAMTKSKVKQES